MGKKEYGWKIGAPPPNIDAHSKTKHKVFEEYLRHYLLVLNSSPQVREFKLVLVDGFAGGGIYTDPIKNELYIGSPLRLINIVQATEKEINFERERKGVKNRIKLYAKYYFIEKQKSNIDYLKKFLGEQGVSEQYRDDVFIIKDQFHLTLDKLINQITADSVNRRCIFILDQYGYKDVPFDDIKRIFASLPNAEIILTFATDWLISYLTDNSSFRSSMEKLGLSSVLNLEEMLETKKDNKDWRRVIQLLLHQAIPGLSGAKHYTPFFITSKKSNRSFWLIHLSNHPRARDVMTQLHWKLANHFTHYGEAGLMMFGYDPDKDSANTGMEDLFRHSEFSFDQESSKKTNDAIIEQLPALLAKYTEGIEYQKFYASIANTTPATSDQIKKCVTNLIELKQIESKGPSGENRRKAVTEKDVLMVPRQSYFVFKKKN